MGIRFQCPNGHKLNVKSFLAGKRGICPHCGEKFTIPSAENGSGDGTEKEPEQTEPSAVSATDASRPVGDETPVATASTREPATAVASSVATSAHAEQTDPIAGAPHAVWYVRPPSGGQFGPATGDIMRNWIVEGRVTSDSLVWREGWEEWSQANTVFPGLTSSAASSTESSEFPNIVPDPTSTGSGYSTRYPRRKRSATLVVLGLAVACLVLFGVLIYVINTRT